MKQADGNLFVLHSLLAESSEGMPGEHRAVTATALLFSGEATAVARYSCSRFRSSAVMGLPSTTYCLVGLFVIVLPLGVTMLLLRRQLVLENDAFEFFTEMLDPIFGLPALGCWHNT